MAGTTAAETIRHRSDKSIMIVTDDWHTLYSRVRLPDYITGKIPRERVFIKEEMWYQENAIDLCREVSVQHLSLNERRADLSNGLSVQYERLLLATGGRVRKLRCPGSELENICYLRTLEDAECMKQAIQSAKKAVVIGGGFIGLEMVRCFIQAGLETVMVMMEPRFWPLALDKESTTMIEEALRQKKVTLHYADQVKEFRGNGRVQMVVLGSGKSYGCDMVGVGIGIDTLHPFIRESGLRIQNGILTDESLQTSDPHVFAAGDVAEFYDVGRAHHNQMGNWTHATEQGKVAGANMCGERNIFQSVSSYVIRVFGLSIGLVGDTTLLPDTEVIQRGSASHGGYVRLFVRDGRIRGATLMNRSHEMRPITELIKRPAKIEPYHSALSDVQCDLESILSRDLHQTTGSA